MNMSVLFLSPPGAVTSPDVVLMLKIPGVLATVMETDVERTLEMLYSTLPSSPVSASVANRVAILTESPVLVILKVAALLLKVGVKLFGSARETLTQTRGDNNIESLTATQIFLGGSRVMSVA